MRTLEIPINRHLGILKTPPTDDFLLSMETAENLKNHVGTLHAAALFGLAEATSGEFLLGEFTEYESEVIPLVRKAEIKFCKPASGKVRSKAMFVESEKEEILHNLEKSRRALIKVKVELYSEKGIIVCSSTFHWFIVKNR